MKKTHTKSILSKFIEGIVRFWDASGTPKSHRAVESDNEKKSGKIMLSEFIEGTARLGAVRGSKNFTVPSRIKIRSYFGDQLSFQ